MSAHELVAATADDRVERTQPRAHRSHHGLQHPIACGMAVAIVHRLELVDVDEGQDERSAGPSRPVDLMGEGQATHLAPIGAGQLIQMSSLQLRFEPGPLAGRLAPVGCGPSAILRRPDPIHLGLGAKLFELLQKLCLAVARGHSQAGRVGVPAPTPLVTYFSHPVPVGGRLVPVARRGLAAEPVPEALDRRTLSVLPRALVCLLVVWRQIAMGRAVPVGGRLVLSDAS